MKVLFVWSQMISESATKPLYGWQEIQLGISYMSSILGAHGHQTRVIVLSRLSGRRNQKIIDECLSSYCPRLICFTAVSTQYQFIASIARYVRNNFPDIYLLIGGPHVSLNPNDALSAVFDALCIGEGEYPLLELVSQLENNTAPSRIPNLWIRNNSGIEKNSPRAFLQDLDSLPLPDREMWKEWISEGKKARRIAVLLGRGCSFQCSYCCNHALARLATGTYARLRSPDGIVDEIRQIAKRYPAQNEIFLELEDLGANREWAIELCSKLEDLNGTLNHSLSFGANLRITPSADLAGLFAACKKAGFTALNIGLESGSERIRREILKRSYSNEDVISAVVLARKHGLKVNLFVMLGLPGERLADFWQTVRIVRACLPHQILASIFFPYPGTNLYFLCKEQGLLRRPVNNVMERKESVLDLPGFRKKQIEKSYIWFDYYVYSGSKPLYRILAKVLWTRLHSSPYGNILLRRISRLAFPDWLRNVFA